MFFPLRFPVISLKHIKLALKQIQQDFFPLSFRKVYPRSSGVPDRYLCKDQVRQHLWANAVEICNL